MIKNAFTHQRLAFHRLLSAPKKPIVDLMSPLRRNSNSIRPAPDYSTASAADSSADKGSPSTSTSTSTSRADGGGSTVDENETQKFAKLCSEWWNENGSLKALHSMNQVRVPWIKRTLCYRNIESRRDNDEAAPESDDIKPFDIADDIFPLKNLHILDVGCGGGLLCEPLARLGAEVTGIDAVEDNVRIAETHLQDFATFRSKINPKQTNLKLHYLTSTVEKLRDHKKSTGGAQFDAVVASEVLEHVSNREIFLQACVDLLKIGGYLFVTTLNRTQLSKFFGIYVAENVLNIVPKGIHDWEKFTEPETLQSLLENYNCSTRLIHGLQYNPFINRWAWSRDKSINYALCAMKCA